MVTCSFCGTVVEADDPPITWTSAVENGKQRWFCDDCSRDAPARDGEQARLGVVVSRRARAAQSAKPGSESSSTERNGTLASSWLSTPTPPAKVRWISMYAGGRFSRSIAA